MSHKHRHPTRRRVHGVLAGLAIVLVALLGRHGPPAGAPSAPPSPALPPSGGGGMDAAIQRTLELIEKGGPFPYKQDGVVFQNREGRLPPQPSGYYHEYTVPTPGATNRGARRIVRGAQGDTWYTDDHYRTFVRIDGRRRE